MAKKNGTLKVTDALADMMRRAPFNAFDIKMADGDTIHGYKAGPIPKKRYATASSPFDGVISYIP